MNDTHYIKAIYWLTGALATVASALAAVATMLWRREVKRADALYAAYTALVTTQAAQQVELARDLQDTANSAIASAHEMAGAVERLREELRQWYMAGRR